MKKSNVFLKSLVLSAFFGLLILAGCKKDNNSTTTTTVTPPVSSSQVANNSTEAEATSNDVLAVSEDAIYYNTNNATKGFKFPKGRKYAWLCATVYDSTQTINNVVWHKLIIDFGADSVACGPADMYRSGQIINYYHGRLFTKGYYDSIVFNNYTLHSRTINGFHVVNNKGVIGGGITWYIDAYMTITHGKKVHSWTTHRERILTVDDTTLAANSAIDALIYEIENQPTYANAVTGVTTQDSTYAVNITSPLKKHVNCFWIETGTVQINITGYVSNGVTTPITNGLEAVINFGTDGVCNDKATLTVNGKTYRIII